LDGDGRRRHAAAGPAQRCALPFLCVLTTTPEGSTTLGKRHKTVGMWAHQMVSLVRRWFPTLPIMLLGDTSYCILELGLQILSTW
jgi:hypothetical protein